MLAPGTTLQSRYTVDTVLGQGGFGTVYRARDQRLHTDVAIKETIDNGAGAAAEFQREARLLAGLSHPALTRVTDSFSEGERHYLVMEYVPGESLSAYLARQPQGRLDADEALRIIEPVLDALEYLHQRLPPIVHRDVKPGNIRITPEGRAVLVDFGLARHYEPGAYTTLGARGETPGYSPLEQYGGGNTDPRSDLYALGATLYTMLSGSAPQPAPQRVMHDSLVPLRQLNPRVPEHIDAAIQRLLAIRPADRIQSTAHLRRALKEPLPAPWPEPAELYQGRPAAVAGGGCSTPAIMLSGLLLVALIAAGAVIAGAVFIVRQTSDTAAVVTIAADPCPYGDCADATVPPGRPTQTPTPATTADVDVARLLFTTTGHTDRALGVAYSADGRRLASVSADQSARIWDAESGSPISTFPLEHSASAVAFAPDGQTIAVGQFFDQPIVLRTSDGAPALPLAGDADALAFSGDGSLLAFGRAFTLQVVRANDGSLVHEFDTSSIEKIALSRDGAYIGAASPFDVQVWRMSDGASLFVLDGKVKPAANEALAFSPDGQLLAAVMRDGGNETVGIWRLPEGTLLREIPLKGAVVNELAWSADGRTLAAATWSGIELLDPQRGIPLSIIPEAGDGIESIAFGPNSGRIAAACRDGALRVWDIGQ